MKHITFFILFQVASADIVLYQPQNIVSVNTGDTAIIECVSNVYLETGARIEWYRKTWIPGNGYLPVIFCLYKNNDYSECKHGHYETRLQIHKAKPNDSGIYYCMYKSGFFSARTFANGTFLIVKEVSVPTTVNLLARSDYPSSMDIQLVCVVSATPHPVLITWNISGTSHKGRMISTEELGGTWTFQNLLSLPKGSWDYGAHVTCEVWSSYSPVQVQWTIQERNTPEEFSSVCQIPLGLAVSLCLLFLLTLVVHLFWTYKQKDKNAPDAKGKYTETSDGILYAHLDMGRLAKGTK